MLNLLNTRIAPAPLVQALPRNIVRIESPMCLPHGMYELSVIMDIVPDVQPDIDRVVEASAGRPSYLHRSTILAAYNLFIPTEE